MTNRNHLTHGETLSSFYHRSVRTRQDLLNASLVSVDVILEIEPA
jgi:hypothetical protein